MAIDDLGRPHDCDLLLDQGWLGDEADAYPGVSCEKLLGPRFALLFPAYARLRSQARRGNAPIERVLVFFGGADGTGQTLRVLEAIDDARFSRLNFDVVVGAQNAHSEEIRSRAARMPNVHLTAPLETLAGLMSRADLFVGAGGMTTWERCCLGLPAIVCWTAENQKAQTLAVAAMGAQIQLGGACEQTPETWREALLGSLADTSNLQRGAGSGMALVDGRGVERVARRLATPALSLRRARSDDQALLLEWANDPDMRNNSFSKAAIAPEQHHVWLERKLADPDAFIWIGEADGREVGQVRFDCHGGRAMVDISISRLCRGKGYGVALLGNAVRMFREFGRREVIEAEVLESNLASRQLFVAAGFSCVADHADERGSYRYTLKKGRPNE
ncbi:MAG: GNAT family N-acetyltransferase [Betaproteobacteria bacterium]|nr:GNAT family N-acetyltransferase [Betaproteobacteria bacterium]